MLSLLDEFVACRTTLDDLQRRIAVLGQPLRITDIARHLTGKSQLPRALHNALASAINQRLTELAAPATAQYRQAADESPATAVTSGELASGTPARLRAATP